jgi:nucleotide-binding universal stress UspA family protein
MYKNILLAVDLEDASSWEKALPVAISITQNYEAQLHIVTVIPSFGMAIVGSYFPDDFEDEISKDVGEKLRRLVEEHVPEGMQAKLHISLGTVYDRIIAKANKIAADLIVMASHQPKANDYLLGQNSARVVRHADQSVLVVRNN